MTHVDKLLKRGVIETTKNLVTLKIPKWKVSDRLYNICMTYPDRKPQWRRNDYGVRLFPQWACDILDKEYDEDSTFLSDYRTV